MGLKRTRGAVYDLKYHLVWVPKYRRMVLKGRLPQRLKEMFQEIAERYDFEIDTQEVMEDHVHIFSVGPTSICSVAGGADFEEHFCSDGVSGVS
jgi:putative transposase